MTLIKKYKAICFEDIKGREPAIQRIRLFIKNFPKKKAIILNGPVGTGKTSLAYAMASETNSEIIEINASDLRNSEQIKNTIGQASQQQSFFGKGKILLIDEVDGINKDDRGGLLELIRLTETTSFPIVITSNNIWDRKFSELRRKSELLILKELNYKTILEILKDIVKKESLALPDNLLTSIAIKSRGDVRAAINDLQTISPETLHDDIHERDKEEDIFDKLKQILQQMPAKDTPYIYDKVNMHLDEILLWLEENIPSEYKGEELYKAFEALSKADIFRGRIHRQQHWRFLVYQNFLLSAGVSSAKKQVKTGFTAYKKPRRILKIWMISRQLEKKKTIAEKYASFCHIGIKRAKYEFPIIRQILIQNPAIQQELKLEKEEIEFLGK